MRAGVVAVLSLKLIASYFGRVGCQRSEKYSGFTDCVGEARSKTQIVVETLQSLPQNRLSTLKQFVFSVGQFFFFFNMDSH